MFCPAGFGVLFCSVVRDCTHLKLFDRVVSGVRFLTWGVFECENAHRRSVAILCMLYKSRCNPMHPLNGALPGSYVPVRVTRGALVAHRYTIMSHLAAEPRMTFVPLSVSLRNDLADPVFDGVGLSGFKSRANVFFWPKLLYPYYSLLLLFPFSSSCLKVSIVRLGSLD